MPRKHKDTTMNFKAKVIWYKANERRVPAGEDKPDRVEIVHHSASLYADVNGYGTAIQVTTPDNADGFELHKMYRVTIEPVVDE